MSIIDAPLGPPGPKQDAIRPKWLFPAKWPRWPIYILAVGMVVATLVLRLSLEETAGERPLLIIFNIPIIISAYLGGLGPGLLATLTAAACSKYSLIPPLQHFSFSRSVDYLQWSILIISGLLVSCFNEALHRSRRRVERLASIPQLNPNPVLEIDSAGAIIYANPAALAILEEVGPQYGLDDFLPPDWHEIQRAAREKGEAHFYRQVQLKDTVLGESIAFAAPFNVYHLYTIDITERQRAEELLAQQHHELQETAAQLEQSRNMLELIIESIPVRVFWKDKDSRYLGCNTLFAQDAGFNQPQQLIGQDDYAMGWKDQADLYHQDDHQVIESHQPKMNIIEPQTTPTGTKIWLKTSKVPLRKPDGEIFGVLGIYDDITERLQAETALSQSLAEKIVLLKEVHHRVKNNLQIVTSLLNLQANRSQNREVIEVLEETGSRVHSMALLHEVLYRSDNLARINFASYVTELCQYLRCLYALAAARVSLDNRVAPVGLPLELSLPCGLIINELVSNALKHAYPGEKRGRITVELNSIPQDRLRLSVRDDGVGLPPGVDPVNASTLGLRLVARLAAQLQGQLTVTRPEASGLAFTLDFPVPPETLAKD